MEDPIHTTAERVTLPQSPEPDLVHAQAATPPPAAPTQETIPLRDLEDRLDRQENCQRSWQITDRLLIGMYLVITAALIIGAALLLRHLWHH